MLDQTELVPFGYYGPLRFRGFGAYSPTAGQTRTLAKGSQGITDDRLMQTQFVEYVQCRSVDGNGGIVYWDTGSVTAEVLEINSPDHFFIRELILVRSTKQGSLASPLDAYFGLDTTRSGSSTRFEDSYVDIVGGLPDELRSTTPGLQTPDDDSTGPTEYQYIFTLDDVTRFSGNYWQLVLLIRSQFSTTQAYYLSGSRKARFFLNCHGF